MRVVIQRVSHAEIIVNRVPGGGIGRGFVALVGFQPSDGQREVDALAAKLVGLRVFSDENGQMNLALADIDGQCMVVPNFTLYADCRKGRRPSFVGAARPQEAAELYERFVQQIRAAGVSGVGGTFGADMQVNLENDGPVTIILDSDDLL